MPDREDRHHRRSIRLPGYDYTSPGAYFLTICVHGGQCLLGEVLDGEMQLNEWGRIAQAEWLASERIRRELRLDAFVVMPNHVHGIVWIVACDDVGAHGKVGAHGGAPNGAAERVGAHGRAPLQVPQLSSQHWPQRGPHHWLQPVQRPPKSLGSFVAGYKSAVTKRINQLRDTPGMPFWQRNYCEHIVRNERSLDSIREYIENNPARWAEDQLHPDALPNPFNRWQAVR